MTTIVNVILTGV